ncbi:hypothetical protein EKO04_004006 [Ascochyta lentis]|uniref:Beta-xylosidase C-terminal Concanavalin A-like domain-containing protein n=1 Tax=Ascochyta lentis TaxID=205686 RepID=A0A8H7J9J3_9PLEO|nr:hypothetical protein EKO04_004006 [Ascochyta lentis]
MGRETFPTPVEWPKDGWPTIQQPRLSFHTTRSVQMGFASAALIKKTRSLPPHTSSTIVLTPTAATLSSPRGPLVLLARRQRGFNTVANATVSLTTSTSGGPIAAGLTVYKDALRHVSISISLAKRIVSVSFVDKSKKYSFSALHAAPIPATTAKVEFQIVATTDDYTFSFRSEGGKWTKVGVADAQLLTTRDFTGIVVGVYAVREGEG